MSRKNDYKYGKNIEKSSKKNLRNENNILRRKSVLNLIRKYKLAKELFEHF